MFAPTDVAFDALLTSLGVTFDQLTPAQLAPMLTYPVLADEVPASEVTGLSTATTVNGADFRIRVEGGKVVLSAGNGDINVTTTDIEASNGVIHVIDKVMLPPTDIPSVAADAGFTSLVAALEKAGLDDDLAGPGPFTVFAPTNAAFAAALQSLGVTVPRHGVLARRQPRTDRGAGRTTNGQRDAGRVLGHTRPRRGGPRRHPRRTRRTGSTARRRAQRLRRAQPARRLRRTRQGARLRDRERGGRATQTETGDLRGTIGVLAPERIARTHDVTAAADVWAWGVTAHEVLAGHALFRADDATTTLWNILHVEAPALDVAVAPDVSALIAACLANDPRARPASCSEVAATVERAARRLGHR